MLQTAPHGVKNAVTTSRPSEMGNWIHSANYPLEVKLTRYICITMVSFCVVGHIELLHGLRISSHLDGSPLKYSESSQSHSNHSAYNWLGGHSIGIRSGNAGPRRKGSNTGSQNAWSTDMARLGTH